VKRKKVREKKYGGVNITLANDAPQLVGTGVITNNLGHDHTCEDEEVVTRRAPSWWGSLETL